MPIRTATLTSSWWRLRDSLVNPADSRFGPDPVPPPTDPQSQKNKICLSFLVSQDGLDLSGLKTGKDDVYLSYWLAGLVPLYDVGGVMDGLWLANWRLLSFLPDARPRRVARRRRIQQPFGYRLGKGLVPLFRWLEPVARRLQEWRFPLAIRQLANRDSRVVTGCRILKFHVGDRRDEFARSFSDKVRAL